MAAGPTVFTVNGAPKLDFRSATLAMSACERSSGCPAVHPANGPTHAVTTSEASVIFASDIAANVPAGGGSAA